MTTLEAILAELVDGLGEDRAADWLALFNFALGGRPIALCASAAGRAAVSAFLDSGDPESWFATYAEPGRHVREV